MGPSSGDTTALSRLAGADPALTHLPGALAEASGTWRLHDVQWDPGRRCRLAWVVPATSAAGPGYRAAELDPGGMSSWDYREDPSLPALPAATDPTTVAGLLEQALGHPVLGCRIEPVRYRPGSHCVLRYEVRTAGGSSTFFAKVFPAEQFGNLAALVAEVAARARSVGLGIPVHALWPDLTAVVTAGVPGRRVSAVLTDPSSPGDQRLSIADRLGGLLAGFHAVDSADAPPRTPTDQLDELAALATCVLVADPRVGTRFTRMLAALRAEIPPAVDPPVLTHGGFRAGQVRLGPSGMLTLLDLDGVALGDPARDLATGVGHLLWQAVRRPSLARLLQQAEEAFLGGYQRRAGVLDAARLEWWRRAGILQVAGRRYRRLEVAEWALVPHLLDRAEKPGPTAARTPDSWMEGLLDPTRMTKLLRPVLLPLAAAPAELELTAARDLAVATGRRRVVQYVVSGLDAEGPTHVVAKIFTEPRRAELLYRHLRLLSEGPFATGRWSVPQPLGYLPEQALVLYRASAGVPLSEVDEGRRALQGVRDAARWLARLHGSDTRLPRIFDTRQEIESTRQWAETLTSYDRSLHEPALRLASQWASPGTVAPDRRVPIHKDFHPGHVLLNGRVCVLDLDEARLGEPAYDLAHFCAYLEWRSDGADRLGHAFLDEYARLTGWADDGAFARYSAYTWLKIAKQLAVHSGPWRAGTDQGWVPADALGRGLAWLDR